MSEENLLTVEQFNNRVTKWALVIKTKAKRTLSEKTNSTGRLALNIDKFVDKLSDHDPAYKVKFNFLRYGVYRSFGAGRGYVIINGQPVRGYRIRSDSEIRGGCRGFAFFLRSGRRFLRTGFCFRHHGFRFCSGRSIGLCRLFRHGRGGNV